jgi:hypothetical protein
MTHKLAQTAILTGCKRGTRQRLVLQQLRQI